MKKDKEWALKEVDRRISYEGVPAAINALEFAKGVINQVNEPKVLLQELPVIPKFVAEFLDERKEYPIYELFNMDFIYDNHNEVAKWLYYNDKKTNRERELSLVLAHVYDYKVEEEQKYYARIKGWENVTTGSESFNWVYFKETDTVGISKAVENKYQSVSFTKYDWNNLGINENNADFLLVEELEE